jgi:hypothetical protein
LQRIHKIAIASTFVAIYLLAMGLVYSAHLQSSQNFPGHSSWHQLNGSSNFFQHTLPAEQGFQIRLQAATQAVVLTKLQSAAIRFAHALHFDSFFSAYCTNKPYLLVDQKQADLLYPFHFFF